MLTDLFSFAEEPSRFSLVKSFCFDAQFLLVSLNSQDIYQFISLITFSIYFKVIKGNGEDWKMFNIYKHLLLYGMNMPPPQHKYQ